MGRRTTVRLRRWDGGSDTSDSTRQPRRRFCQHWVHGTRYDVTAENISKAVKMAATALDYPVAKGIPIQRVNTHSLRSGGANALALAGYSDTQIQKMGRWKGATFKEYIREELACFSTGMSKDMKRKFNFVNIAGNAFHDVTDAVLELNQDEAQ